MRMMFAFGDNDAGADNNIILQELDELFGRIERFGRDGMRGCREQLRIEMSSLRGIRNENASA